MRHATILSVLCAAACASTPGPSTAVSSTPDRTVFGSGAGDGLRIVGGDPKVTVVLYPIDRVWNALPEVYDSLGIRIGDIDGERRIIGNTDIKVTKQLAGVPLSKYLDCGKGQGFQSADTYMIQMSILTQLLEDKSPATTITTMIEATAKPMAFGGVVVRCSSTYALETRIVDGVKARLRK